MPHRFITAGTLAFTLVACAGGDQPDERPAGIDSAIAAFAAESSAKSQAAPPTEINTIIGNDTAVARVAYLCLPDLPVFAIYWRGEHPRVTLNVADSQLSLPQVISASGARYRIDSPATEWWNKGDSATFSFDKSRLACGPSTHVEF